MNRVKIDSKGRYVVCEGWIARPEGPTNFVAGQQVKAERHRYGGRDFGARVQPMRRHICPPERWALTFPAHWHPVEGQTEDAAKLRAQDLTKAPAAYLSLQDEFQRGNVVA